MTRDDDTRLGTTVTHRRYVTAGAAHYGGGLVDGAYLLGMFADAATEVCIRTDADEGLLAGYDRVAFLAPVRTGDVVEVTAAVRRVGVRSRTLDFEARIICRGDPARGPSAGSVLATPVLACSATGTVVVPG